MVMKKRLSLLFFMLCADSVVLPTLYAHSTIDQLHEQVQDYGGAILDLDDDDIISDDEDLLAILDESMDEPSLLWTWFQTVGSSLVAHCIHAQRYMGRLIDRMKLWFKFRNKQETQKIMKKDSYFLCKQRVNDQC
jgi:hypothetical protein